MLDTATGKYGEKRVGLRKRSATATKNYIVETRDEPQLLPTFHAKCNAKTVDMSAPYVIRPDTNQVCKTLAGVGSEGHRCEQPWWWLSSPPPFLPGATTLG